MKNEEEGGKTSSPSYRFSEFIIPHELSRSRSCVLPNPNLFPFPSLSCTHATHAQIAFFRNGESNVSPLTYLPFPLNKPHPAKATTPHPIPHFLSFPLFFATFPVSQLPFPSSARNTIGFLTRILPTWSPCHTLLVNAGTRKCPRERLFTLVYHSSLSLGFRECR